MKISALILMSSGLLISISAYFNWDWFMLPGGSCVTTSLFGGREQARLVWALLGCTFLVLGTLSVFGLVTIW